MAGRSDTDDNFSTNPKRRRMVKKQNVFVDNFQGLMNAPNTTSTVAPDKKREVGFAQSPAASQIVILENRQIIPSPAGSFSQDPLSDFPVQGNEGFLNTSVDPSLNDVISFQPEQLEMLSADFIPDTQKVTDISEKLTFLEKMETKLDQKNETDEKIFRSLARMEAKLDALAQGLHERPVETMPLDIMKPIKTIEEAIILEEALKDQVNQMKIKLAKNLRSINCCYSLVDLFFERSFFSLCSWSGQSRSKDIDKYAFKSFRRILNCFFTCVRSIDGDFTFGECESFFKDKSLKHSVQREKANTGRLSRIKHRPIGIPNKKYAKSTPKSKINDGTCNVNRNNVHQDKEEDTNMDSENKENESFRNNTIQKNNLLKSDEEMSAVDSSDPDEFE